MVADGRERGWGSWLFENLNGILWVFEILNSKNIILLYINILYLIGLLQVSSISKIYNLWVETYKQTIILCTMRFTGIKMRIKQHPTIGIRANGKSTSLD